MFAAKKTLRYNSFNVIVKEYILVLAFAENPSQLETE
jgi:hypothetical protein